MHPPARRINPDSLLVALAARPRIVGIDAVNPLPATSLAWRLSIASDLPSLALITGIQSSVNEPEAKLTDCVQPTMLSQYTCSVVCEDDPSCPGPRKRGNPWCGRSRKRKLETGDEERRNAGIRLLTNISGLVNLFHSALYIALRCPVPVQLSPIRHCEA